MKFERCPTEREVIGAVRSGEWPAGCEPSVREHVKSCRSCGEIASLSAVFSDARNDAAGRAQLGAPGLLFWKAQLRRRNQAMERVARPILAIEIVGLAITLIVLALVAWKWLYQPESALLSTGQGFSTLSLVSNWGWMLLGATGVTLALFGGIALYLVASKE